jgi:hypothetical protein
VRRTARVRSLAPLAVLALVAATTAGCNDDSGKDADAQETVVVDQNGQTIGGDPDALPAMTPDQISQAVLQDDNMGDGWTSAPYTDSDTAAPGCLSDVKTLTAGLQKKDKGGTEFSYGDTPSVDSTVSAYADATALGAVFDQVQVAVAACTKVTGPDGDGNNWDVTLTSTDDPGYEGVDDQYSVSGTGTLTTPDGTTVDIYLEQTAVRIGANVASVSTFDLQSRTTEHDAWAQIAVDRFVAVANGDEPAATTAPAPAASAS